MTPLTTPQRLLMMQTLFQLDEELAHYDLEIARLLCRRRNQVLPQRRRRNQVQPQRRAIARRSLWVREWYLDREADGQYRFLMEKLRLKDVQAFKNFTRMEPDFFCELLEKLRPRIEKQDTFYRKSVCAGTRLALTLRFFATGESYRSLRYNWLVADNTISKIVREVAQAIIDEFGEEVLMPPLTEEGWLQVAEKFSTRWNFHHTLGALDGKHVAIKRPSNSGSLYYNYKGFFSIVMLALVDANYKFMWVDVGTNGSSSDSQIFNSCDLKEMIEDDKLGIPPAAPFPGGDRDVPYFFVGDDAFALRSFMMKPYSRRDLPRPQAAFNYRLSRARRIVENAFGILANRFGCLMTTMRVTPGTVANIVLACCILHNLLRDAKAPVQVGLIDEEDAEHNLVPGQFRRDCDLTSGDNTPARNSGTKDAKAQRDYLKDYYNSDLGAVSWQDRAIDSWRD